MHSRADVSLRTAASGLLSLVAGAPTARAWRLVLLMALAGLDAAPASAQAPPPAIASVAPLQATDALQRALPHALLLEDASRALTLEQVRARTSGWTPAQGAMPGFSRSVWWLRLAIDNPGAEAQALVFDLQQPLQDHVHWFLLDRQGALLFERATGDRLPFSSRPLAYRGLALPLTVPPHDRRELLIRIDSHDGLFESIDPVLSGAAAFRARGTDETLLYGLFFGILLALTAYNLLVWLASREQAFGPYVLFAASFLLWSFTYSGFAAALFWPDAPDLHNQILAVSAALSLAAFGQFNVQHLHMRERGPRWQWQTLRALIVLNLLTIPLALADQYAWAFLCCIPAGLLLMALSPVVSLHQLRRGFGEAKLFFASFLPIGVGMSIVLLQLVGLLPQAGWTSGLWQIGAVFQMLTLALALADSLKRMRIQKLDAERQARALQAQLAAGLEQQVRARTAELEAANRRLAELNITDALTGAFNRRHFDQRCSELLSAARRQPMPVALCMIDIDHFKAFNDSYGHQAGDSALKAVAEALNGRLRRGTDALFRLGGEEFGVLFSATSHEQVAAFVEDMRRAVRQLERPHVRSAAGILTASFGLGFWAADEIGSLSVEALYSTADRLLYEAKAGGRDRVVTASSRRAG